MKIKINVYIIYIFKYAQWKMVRHFDQHGELYKISSIVVMERKK